MRSKNEIYDGDYVIAIIDRKNYAVCGYAKSVVFKNFANGDNLRIYHGPFDDALVFKHRVNAVAILTIANYQILKSQYDYQLMTIRQARDIDSKGKKKEKK